ncbi:Putative F-box/LRR-repeat protein [Striga hermonthica]|uniref:F-box/LRR-repeat protein n=1 Tax=Striga hermonthica TaxID=68872 RepID=A0A9N7RMZ6_STRHE|nr:Putative F-box/LRR-repeat protein [Striga hermonthica]
MEADRISQLPIHILHHIVCFISQKEAVRTCLLSKKWRHIGLTRPNLEFFEDSFDLSRTLQGYLDQNLSIHKLRLDLSTPVSPPVISLLNKWIPLIAALNVKAFELNFLSYTPAYYDLPSEVFLAESLEELQLCKCRLIPVESVRFRSLRKLTLKEFQVDGRTFDTKMLGCPLLRCLVLIRCWELKRYGRSIKIDVPNLETITINGKWIWCHRRSAFLFSHLTRLDLHSVILSSESFDLFLFRCPTLAKLTLDNCSGFEEFHLASDSVRFLTISTPEILLKGVKVCAPNILDFKFRARIPQVPDTLSFTSTASVMPH